MMLMLNAIICSLIVLRIALFERTGRHRLLVSICAYFIAVAAGLDVIMTLYALAPTPSYAAIFLKAVLCVAIFNARGNVASLLTLSPRRQRGLIQSAIKPQQRWHHDA